jgi:hypothetical protein
MAIGLQFFSTLRIPMLAGRGFTSTDFASAATTDAAEQAAQRAWGKAAVSAANGYAVVAKPAAALRKLVPIPIIVNESFARKLFPKESPIDKHIGDCQGDDYPLGALEPG